MVQVKKTSMKIFLKLYSEILYPSAWTDNYVIAMIFFLSNIDENILLMGAPVFSVQLFLQ